MSSTLKDEDKNLILSHIRDVEDFPQPGIVFKDITPLLGSTQAFNTLMDHLTERYLGYELDYIAGIDARGFIFGSVLADRSGGADCVEVCFVIELKFLNGRSLFKDDNIYSVLEY
ncbi:MAG: hypothetical protein P8Y46_08530 [Sulfurovaceae bacterium]